MNDQFLSIPSDLLDWIAVFGYLAFLVFIAWRVLTTK